MPLEPGLDESFRRVRGACLPHVCRHACTHAAVAFFDGSVMVRYRLRFRRPRMFGTFISIATQKSGLRCQTFLICVPKSTMTLGLGPRRRNHDDDGLSHGLHSSGLDGRRPM